MNVDSRLSTISEDPVQNKVIYSALNSIDNALNVKQNTITIVPENDFTLPSELNEGEIILVYEN